MGEQDTVSLVALLVSLIALLVTAGQLIQQIFGTAENYRRTNAEIIGPFARTRRRIFHMTELRLETKFMTPHFSFSQLGTKGSTCNLVGDFGRDGLHFKSWADYENYNKKRLHHWIDKTAGVSLVKRWQNSAKPDVRRHLRPALTAGWLTLIDQIFAYGQLFLVPSIDRSGLIHVHGSRGIEKANMPTLELVEWSWDLLPPDIVRPLASINLGDLLLLCYRLRIAVNRDQFKPAERLFSAGDSGHNFSSLNVQGLGLVLQYRFDQSARRYLSSFTHANVVPTIEADQMAFGIIPINSSLGINESWDLGNNDYLASVAIVLDRLGVSDTFKATIAENQHLDIFNQCVALLCPFLPIRGLNIVKYVSPIRSGSVGDLYYREGRLVFRARLNENLGRTNKSSPSKLPLPKPMGDLITFVSDGFNFLESLDPLVFPRARITRMFEQNANSKASQDRLHDLLSLAEVVDQALVEILRAWDSRLYIVLVGAHLDNCLTKKLDIKALRAQNNERGFRDGTGDGTCPLFMTERVHRYVDSIDHVVKTAVTRFEDYLVTGKPEARDLKSDIRDCWWLMMLRGCLWEMTHYRVYQHWLPFRSQYYGDRTQVLIA